MSYAIREVLEFVKQNDVKFIRLAFCDIFGTQKNISIMPDELERAFKEGVSFDASAIKGFGDVVNSVSIEPMSIYVTGDGKRMCTVLVNPASIRRGRISAGVSGVVRAVTFTAVIAATIRAR